MLALYLAGDTLRRTLVRARKDASAAFPLRPFRHPNSPRRNHHRPLSSTPWALAFAASSLSLPRPSVVNRELMEKQRPLFLFFSSLSLSLFLVFTCIQCFICRFVYLGYTFFSRGTKGGDNGYFWIYLVARWSSIQPLGIVIACFLLFVLLAKVLVDEFC